MADKASPIITLGDNAAYQLANVTKTVPQFDSITPRWLTRFLDWKPLEAGAFRLNKVKEGDTVTFELKEGKKGLNAANVKLA